MWSVDGLRAIWRWFTSPDSPEVQVAAGEQARWRTDLLTVIVGPILIVVLVTSGVMQLHDIGVTPLLFLPIGLLGMVVTFCVWRLRRWRSTRGREPGRHRS